MTRTVLDPRRSALRAAARVALFGAGAGVGCGSAPSDGLRPPAADPARDDGKVDAGAVPEPLDGGPVIVTDAGVVRDAGLDAGVTDAGEICDREALTPDDYIACCERLGWSWDRGCAAWGPPAPPSTEEVG